MGDRMTLHEALALIDRFNEHFQASVESNEVWCWPTREQLAYNIEFNRHCFSSVQGWRVAMSAAWKNGWIGDQRCTQHCRSRHVILTSAGREALQLMNEHGCQECTDDHYLLRVRFARKLAIVLADSPAITQPARALRERLSNAMRNVEGKFRTKVRPRRQA